MQQAQHAEQGSYIFGMHGYERVKTTVLAIVVSGWKNVVFSFERKIQIDKSGNKNSENVLI
jgi:hypothetical protein